MSKPIRELIEKFQRSVQWLDGAIADGRATNDDVHDFWEFVAKPLDLEWESMSESEREQVIQEMKL